MKSTESLKNTLVFLIILVFPLIFSMILNFSIISSVNSGDDDSECLVYLSQENDNFTVKTSFPKMIWIEGNLKIEIESDLEGKVKCIFIDSKGGKYFGNNQIIERFTGSRKTIEIVSKPHLITLPGKYTFELLITFVDENEDSDTIYEKTYNIILGMGYLVLYCILIIFSTAIIVILTQQPNEEEIKVAQQKSQPSNLPADKIQCPDCNKIIDEGLAFCPECGSRIPEFLRFGPSSTGI